MQKAIKEIWRISFDAQLILLIVNINIIMEVRNYKLPELESIKEKNFPLSSLFIIRKR
ncbi:hypothetical protein HYD56_00845 [Mycoplasmopsis bovis]|nr:hypothetical protein [Mycoplasmopsis bovis]QQH66514.1 hypothetical protein HYD56_00845 [Mycoplasmopsis bovis]